MMSLCGAVTITYTGTLAMSLNNTQRTLCERRRQRRDKEVRTLCLSKEAQLSLTNPHDLSASVAQKQRHFYTVGHKSTLFIGTLALQSYAMLL